VSRQAAALTKARERRRALDAARDEHDRRIEQATAEALVALEAWSEAEQTLAAATAALSEALRTLLAEDVPAERAAALLELDTAEVRRLTKAADRPSPAAAKPVATPASWRPKPEPDEWRRGLLSWLERCDRAVGDSRAVPPPETLEQSARRQRSRGLRRTGGDELTADAKCAGGALLRQPAVADPQLIEIRRDF
jgi:hypothetical protein